ALTIDETAARPVVLVIDDLQWADSASVKLWGRLARTAPQVPLLLIGMTRSAPQRDDLLALRRGVPEGSRLQLDALTQAAVAELVGTLAGGWPDTGLLRLAAGAAGNPLYLTELFAALGRSDGIAHTSPGTAQLAAESVPDSLPGAIADRLGFVSAPTREVLRAAALLGVEFALTDLTAVLGRSVTDLVPALDEARASGVLIDASNGVGLAFRHPLIREALYAELPTAVRSVWHRDAGHALATAGAAPDRVARQLLRSIDEPGTASARNLSLASRPAGTHVPVVPAAAAGGLALDIERPPVELGAPRSAGPVDEWMLDWLATSADSLVGQAPAVAAELLAQAVAGVPAGSVKHGWLASRLADALYRTSDYQAAERVAERALVYATDPDLIVDLQWTLAQCRMRFASGEESFAALGRAIAAPGITPKHRARLLVLAARTHLYFGDIEASGREADHALAAATEANDTWATGWALHVLATMASIRGELTEALPLYDRALAMTETDPALNDLSLLLQINKAGTLCNLDRWDEGLATAERAGQLADRVGTSVRLGQAHTTLGQALYEMGRWDGALTEIAVVPEDLKEPLNVCCELGIAAEICFHRNEPDTARRHLAAAEPHWQRVEYRTIPSLVRARSLDREQAGQCGEATAILTALFEGNPDDLGEIEELLGDATRLALKTGDKETAQALTGKAATLAEGSAIPHRQANALYCRGLVDRDASVLLAAAQQYADAGRPLPRAKAL
ncbi:MAG TPA: tetratricopeptide repeat protein, partial [Trebonia sp.]